MYFMMHDQLICEDNQFSDVPFGVQFYLRNGFHFSQDITNDMFKVRLRRKRWPRDAVNVEISSVDNQST